jgi:hypothetical protein
MPHIPGSITPIRDTSSSTYEKVLSITVVDDVAPTVTSVSVPPNAWYTAGQNLDFTVNLSEAVIVNTTGGTPRIALTIGTTTVYATYASGSGTNALVFSYTVQASELDTDGITVGALGLNGGTIQDAAGNNATLTLNSVGSTTAVKVDAVVPIITNVVLNTSSYKIGDTLTATITVNSDTDTYALTSGTINGRALGSLSKTNATTYTATYTVTAGDTDVFSGHPTVNLVLTDSAGNVSSAYTTAIAASTLIDANAPTDISLSASTVLIAANSTAGTLSATDTNSGSETFTYTLVAGNGTNDADNSCFTIVGNALQVAGTALTTGTKYVNVRVTDAGGNSYDKAFTISAVSGPAFTSGATASFAENATGTVYTAAATVSTGGGAVVWDALTGTDASVFSFDTTTGVLTFLAPPDFETKSSYAVTINAHDGNGSTSQSLTVTVTDVNEAPTLTPPTAGAYTDTSANDTFTASTGTLAGADVDASTTLTYGITGGTVSGGNSTLAGTYGSLSVNTSTGAYTYTPSDSAINGLTANTTDTFTVTVSDGTLSATATYTVNLTAANDTPTLATPTAGPHREAGQLRWMPPSAPPRASWCA